MPRVALHGVGVGVGVRVDTSGRRVCFADDLALVKRVSNFVVKQLEEALSTGVKIAVNQLLCYNLIFRAVELQILPFCPAPFTFLAHGIGVRSRPTPTRR